MAVTFTHPQARSAPLRLVSICALVVLVSTRLPVSGIAAESGSSESATQAPTYDNISTVRMKVGVEISAGDSAFRKLVATFPLPMDWPEQTVTIVDKQLSSHIAKKVRLKVLDAGARQVEVRIPQLAAGETARAVYVIDVTRRWANAPADTQAFEVPRQVPRVRGLHGELGRSVRSADRKRETVF